MMRREEIIAACMLANRKCGTIYTGASTDLSRRAFEHRERARPGFTARYDVARLVWYEPFDMIVDAFARERTIKGWPRQWRSISLRPIIPMGSTCTPS
jgi:putative endonuclease